MVTQQQPAVNRAPREAGEQPPFPQQTPGSQQKMRPKPDVGEHSYRGYQRLSGKVALVTGADSGIGQAVALAFAREGADVAFGYLSEYEDAQETTRLVESAGRDCLAVAGDLVDEAACRHLVEKTVERFGRIDILVNNAAFQGQSVQNIEEISAERLQRSFGVNILAMFHLVKAALLHMQPGATVINTASIQAYQPSYNILDYAATKGAIVAFTKVLAEGLIEKGIRVNSVAPGPVWTPLIPQSYDEERTAQHGQNSPMKRPAQPAELAPAYVFLACEDSRYINAEILGVTGGKPLA